MQNGKSPGPDGFNIEFYKKFANQITAIVHRMFSHPMESERLPPTLYEANISLLLKQDRDKTEPSSYCPISMLNIDFKILRKVLANRLNKCIEFIIHNDQTGFIPNRISFEIVRCVMDVMYNPFDKPYKQVILCLDAEKAFNQVEWPYLMRVLEKFDFSPTFISWVHMLYVQPTAAVLTNLDRSSFFPLQRGMRQGCPLSPLLFPLAIEPLAISVREHSHIKPITLGGVDHKISLYADDLALFVSDPEQSVPHLLQLITSIGEVSGYTINWQKSKLIQLTNDLDSLFLSSTQFRIAPNYVKYLGIKIYKKVPFSN